MTLADALAGKSIASMSFEKGYYTIMFGDSSGIHVFNYVGPYEPGLVSGLKISSVRDDEEEIEMILEEGSSLVISLRENDYVGPEAFHYFDPKNNLSMVD